jgi:hypothetical protein
MEKEEKKIVRSVKEIEDDIADLKGRWPAHSVSPSLWQELERLEEELASHRSGSLPE